MRLDYTDKTIIITGGTRGIGASMARAFCGAGANVVVTGTKKVKDINPDVTKCQNNTKYHQLDSSSDESIMEFINTINELDRINCINPIPIIYRNIGNCLYFVYASIIDQNVN